MLFLLLLLMVVGCVTTKEVVYKRVYFADTNGVTTIYYPDSMEKDLKTPHDDERWKYVAAQIAPERLSDEYHNQHPECSYSYQK
jgi:hypothetical protein